MACMAWAFVKPISARAAHGSKTPLPWSPCQKTGRAFPGTDCGGTLCIHDVDGARGRCGIAMWRYLTSVKSGASHVSCGMLVRWAIPVTLPANAASFPSPLSAAIRA